MSEAPPLVARLRDAIIHRRKVDLTYTARDGAPSTRAIDPWTLADKDGRWYLVAGTAEGRRTFRLDRVATAVVLDTPAEPPPAGAGEDTWDSVVASIEDRRGLVTARRSARPGALPMLRQRFGRSLTLGGYDGAGVTATVAGPSADWVARLLASFADGVVVHSPEAVRARMAEIGAGLVSAYSTDE